MAATDHLQLTFDDGPSEHTLAVLDLLAEASVRATFFMVGTEVAERPEIAQRVHADGHTIGNHSHSHPRLADLDDDGVRGELRGCAEALAAAGIPKPTVCRPPYGSTDERVERLIQAEGMKQMLWDVDPEDWSSKDPAEILRRIDEQAWRGPVLLLHDGRGERSATVAALAELLRRRA